MTNRHRKHQYICSTERFWKDDETEVIWYSDNEYTEGDWFVDTDGLKRYVEMVIY